MLRLIHTADWHLGHTLHGVSREVEHRAFLSWLLDRLESEAADALIVAGDIFDVANPPAYAMEMWYEFIAAARRRMTELDMVFVAGNHDSAPRLDAPNPVLKALGVHVVGRLPRQRDGTIDSRQLLVPLRKRGGDIAAWCAAVPYLRPADLPQMSQKEGLDNLVEGVRQIYADLFGAALELRELGQAVVATGHCYMVDSRLSELSERKILGGNQHALPVRVFPRSLSYVALGHLHLAQTVGERVTVRYCGSPIPLALDEASYTHQVLRVDLDGDRVKAIEKLPVPRRVPIIRLPEVGPLPLPQVEALIDDLPDLVGPPADPLRPYLEVRVELDGPEPGLRQLLGARLEGKAPRLLKIDVCYTGDTRVLAERESRPLNEISPEQVFRHSYAQLYPDEPSAELLAAFHELLEDVQAGEIR